MSEAEQSRIRAAMSRALRRSESAREAEDTREAIDAAREYRALRSLLIAAGVEP